MFLTQFNNSINLLKINYYLASLISERAGVFRKLQTPASPLTGQALQGSAESYNDSSSIYSGLP